MKVCSMLYVLDYYNDLNIYDVDAWFEKIYV